MCVHAYVRARRVCVCASVVFARHRVACEELDLSFRGIRHLKREEVKATQIGIKHQPTSAPSSAKLMKTSARSSHRTSSIYFISLGFIIWHLRSRVQPGRRIFRECDSTANNILELTSNRQYSGWVRFFLILTFSANWTHFVIWLHWCPCYWLDNMHAPTFLFYFRQFQYEIENFVFLTRSFWCIHCGCFFY